jgi:hypothetical protein
MQRASIFPRRSNVWIIGEYGFVAICQDRDEPGKLLVRARSEADLVQIEQYLGDQPFEKWFDPEADYRWRLRANRLAIVRAVMQAVQSIDYDTLKKRVHENDELAYYNVLVDVWDDLKQLEEIPDTIAP